MTTIVTDRSVQLAFVTQRMTISSELKRLLRAVETTYYLCLFSSGSYEGQHDGWGRWARIGFATGLQESPLPGESVDRLKVSTFSDGKSLTFTASGGNPDVWPDWLEVLRQVDNLRPEVQPLPGPERVQALIGSGRIDRIIQPVDSQIAQRRDHERTTIEGARYHALESLTFPIITRSLITEYTG